MITFLKAVLTHFSNSNTFEKGAALAYYTVFSFVPMIVIIVSLLGIIFGEKAISGELFAQMQSFLGDAGAKEIESIVKNQHTNHNSTATTIAGFATLALSATGMFTQIQNSFNTIWEVKPIPTNGLIKYLTNHLSAFSILITVGFILIMSTTLSSFFYKHIETLPTNLHIYEHLISIVLIAIAFAIMYKYLGDANFSWKTVLITGIFTSVLFFVGKLGIGMYIGQSKIASTFGAASAIALLMVWVYYTSQIIFLGASFAFEYEKRKKRVDGK
ncbi:MAG: YihY/virulence factor BrkB family protein [Saprospiraceae bacterium]